MRAVYLSRCGLILLLFLAVLNVGLAQDSLGMSRVSVLDYWEDVKGIQMVGDIAYFVSSNIMHVVDLADPSNPVEIGQGSWLYSYSGCRVCVTDTLAYVATGFGVVVFDVSDPAHPETLVEWSPWPGSHLEDFMVLGDIAIMKMFEGPLHIVDISDLENIHIIGGNFPSTPARGPVGMVGDYLCLNGFGLSMWDISDPTQPVKVAEIDTQFHVGATVILGDRAYATTFTDGLRIIDISDPLQPFEIGACDTGACEAVTITGNYTIVSKGLGLNIWNVADPTQPVFESTFGPQIRFTSFLSSSGNLVCAGDFDAHSPALLVVDITDPHAPTEVSTFGTKGYLNRVLVNNTIGYIAGNWSDLHTIDLSDPEEVIQLGISNEILPRGSMDVAVRGNYAYTSSGSGGMMVFDVSNPAQPEYITCEPETVFMQRIAIAGDYAYVIDGYSGSPFWLRTFSLADPAAPECVNTLHITNYASGYFGYEASNGYLYLGREAGFYVYSLANPAAPELVGSCGIGGFARDLTMLDRYVYLACEIGGVRIIDVGDPSNPVVVGSDGEPTWALAASGNTLITFGTNDISVKDITNRLHPVTISYFIYNNNNERVEDMDILGQYLLTAGGCKFRVYRCDALNSVESPEEITPHEFALHPCYPNPFNSNLVVPFTLPIQSKATITIYNVLGQQVYQFDPSPLSPGTHQVLWDAGSLSSGVYIVQMSANGAHCRQKSVLLK